MRFVRGKTFPVALLGLALLVVPQAYGYMVLHLSLVEMCDRAATIFRGTVVDITPGTIEVAGAELPTVTYKLEASEVFKGEIPAAKGVQVIEVTMLGTVKAAVDSGNLRKFTALPKLPQLTVGNEYLLLTTSESRLGLSTTVGLGQGCFDIFHDGAKTELAANQLNNQGLFAGPVEYTALAAAIQDALGQ